MTQPDNLSERQVFEAALQLEGEAREAYLLDLGAERERRVRALLAAHERPELAPTPSQPVPVPLAGRQRVGPYRLLERFQSERQVDRRDRGGAGHLARHRQAGLDLRPGVAAGTDVVTPGAE